MKARGKPTARIRATGAPFLHEIETLPEKIDPTAYPFNIRAFSHGTHVRFRSNVTSFVPPRKHEITKNLD